MTTLNTSVNANASLIFIQQFCGGKSTSKLVVKAEDWKEEGIVKEKTQARIHTTDDGLI